MQVENSTVDPTLLEHMFLDFMQMKDFAKDPIVMKSASGVWYQDINGKKYLDGLSGVFTVNIGHGNRRVIDAMKAQLEELTFAPPLHSTNLRAIELTKLVSPLMPGDLHTLKYFSGGSEATEAAMKLARQYHKQTGNPGKYKVISRYESYHGATTGSLAASGVSRRKTPFEPFPTGYVHVFPPTCYRCPFGLQYPDCAVVCATIVEKVIRQEDPSTVSALIVEPIGNTGGIITPPEEYFHILREICDKYNVLLIHDEIITGFGRTGEMFASQTFRTAPDIICMGKGMSSGYSPVGAIAISDRIAAAFDGKGEENKQFNHGHTFGANPLSAAAAIASISEIKDRGLPEKGKRAGERIWAQAGGDERHGCRWRHPRKGTSRRCGVRQRPEDKGSVRRRRQLRSQGRQERSQEGSRREERPQLGRLRSSAYHIRRRGRHDDGHLRRLYQGSARKPGLITRRM